MAENPRGPIDLMVVIRSGSKYEDDAWRITDESVAARPDAR